MPPMMPPSPAFLSTVTAGTSFLSRSVRPFLSRRRCTFARPPSWGRPGSGRILAMAAVDLKFVKENLPAVRQNILDRAVCADADLVVTLYDNYVALSQRIDVLRRARNDNAAQMKRAATMQPDERAACVADGKRLKAELAALDVDLVALEADLHREAARIPNMAHPSSPRGAEDAAALVAEVGIPRDFAAEGLAPRPHLALATALDLVDFENAARVAGNKFYYLRNEGALLELALVNWAMTEAARRGFTVMTTPDVAREEVVAGCGFAPRGESSQVYRVADSELCLVGTAEIPLGGYYSGQIVAKEQLPLKMAAFSHCFRREVGAAGATTRGLYRVHQFSKVELFVIASPEESSGILEELRTMEEDMYASLGLHFKVLDMPTQDLGNPAYRKYDIEAWMPGRESYGEISSASNCTDYQARRLNIRYKEGRGDNRYVHTLNATACAVPRMIIALLETHQQKDGSIRIPEVLRPFMGGKEFIGKDGADGRVRGTENLTAAAAAVGQQ